jgi:hypothetical protein
MTVSRQAGGADKVTNHRAQRAPFETAPKGTAPPQGDRNMLFEATIFTVRPEEAALLSGRLEGRELGKKRRVPAAAIRYAVGSL